METNLCESLLSQWCERMLALQITDNTDDGLYGGILCPACSRVHGRCLDALYPFMQRASQTGDVRYLEAAKLLFDWAERVVSRPDGSFVNDTNSDWRGITVFSVIQLCEALKYHGHLLDEATTRRWKARIGKAADFLCGFAEIYNNNVNYRITNALAMQYAGELLGEARYLSLAAKSAATATDFITDDGLLFGEGRPSDGYTPRGCRAVDIGYNVEESLPSMAVFAHMTGSHHMEAQVARALSAQLGFMLPDGGWDNSFGTRNFKWTYWGSRTSDGCILGYLLLAKHDPAFVTAARRNLRLLADCTHDGLLHGGPHYHAAGERPCVHHTFTHAKVLAGVLDHGLSLPEETAPLPRVAEQGLRHLPDLDSYRLHCGDLLATLTCYDWEYLPGGHASGGNVTMLWHPAAGPVLCATMSEYTMKEANNQQLPRFARHECLSPALELWQDGTRYTTLYDFNAQATVTGDTALRVSGQLVDITHHAPAQPLHHTTDYRFTPEGLAVAVTLTHDAGAFVCPLIALGDEPVELTPNQVVIHKPQATVTLTVTQGTLTTPYQTDRCYNLVAGLQAVKAVIAPQSCQIAYTITIKEA